ncbi:MAG: TIGR00153 family protein [SAR324 cluster bacterium]|nr:TIGR00153 family protein [SAR324 cluster bacterium]
MIRSIFGKSPFAALQKHMFKSVEAVLPLKAFFEALHRGDYAELEILRGQINEAEEAADLIKNQVRDHLPRSMFMPIDRRDLLDVLDMQDSIADTAQDIAELLELRKMSLPEEMQADLILLVEDAEKVCVMGREISHEFSILVESGFGTKACQKLLKMIDQLSAAESEADQIEAQLSRQLFQFEDKLKPVDAVFWYKIFEWIGDLADYTEKMGNRIRLMVARS